YTTSGAVVNTALITGLNEPSGIAISGDKLFVANLGTGVIGEYTTSGAPVNVALISGFSGPEDLAVSGDKLFVVNWGDRVGTPGSGTVGEYTPSGVPVNTALITGLTGAVGIAVVPEPGGLEMAVIGLASLMVYGRRRHTRQTPAHLLCVSIPTTQ